MAYSLSLSLSSTPSLSCTKTKLEPGAPACNPSPRVIGKKKKKKDQDLKVISSHMESSRPAWATGDFVSKKKKIPNNNYKDLPPPKKKAKKRWLDWTFHCFQLLTLSNIWFWNNLSGIQGNLVSEIPNDLIMKYPMDKSPGQLQQNLRRLLLEIIIVFVFTQHFHSYNHL